MIPSAFRMLLKNSMDVHTETRREARHQSSRRDSFSHPYYSKIHLTCHALIFPLHNSAEYPPFRHPQTLQFPGMQIHGRPGKQTIPAAYNSCRMVQKPWKVFSHRKTRHPAQGAGYLALPPSNAGSASRLSGTSFSLLKLPVPGTGPECDLCCCAAAFAFCSTPDLLLSHDPPAPVSPRRSRFQIQFSPF